MCTKCSLIAQSRSQTELFTAMISFLFYFQNDEDASDFDLPPSWVAPVEISLKGGPLLYFVSKCSSVNCCNS